MEHCDTRELLRSRKIRVTRRKLAILGEIAESLHPLSASDLHGRLITRMPLDLATIYRTLAMLRERHLVREITDATGTQYYEIACKHNPVHPHFKCVRCSRISCLSTLEQDETALMARFAGNCEIHEISITLSGICGQCRENES
jgi:Fur family transcriptional regulator, ferric uptake regulator